MKKLILLSVKHADRTFKKMDYQLIWSNNQNKRHFSKKKKKKRYSHWPLQQQPLAEDNTWKHQYPWSLQDTPTSLFLSLFHNKKHVVRIYVNWDNWVALLNFYL